MSSKEYTTGTRLIWMIALMGLCRAKADGGDDDSEQNYSSDEFLSSDVISQKVESLEREGSEYLQKIMKQLQEDRNKNEVKEVFNPDLMYTHNMHDYEYFGSFTGVTPEPNITGPTPISEIELDVSPDAYPHFLNQEQISALYQAAVQKASQIKPNLKDSLNLEEEVSAWEANKIHANPSDEELKDGPLSGYYYYYFPIKNLDGLETDSSKTTPTPSKATSNPVQQLHATVTMIDSPNKSLEPLFMAISGFIGMALMLLFSVLLLPRYHNVKTKKTQLDSEEDMGTLIQIILEAMSGRDCSERLACEFTQIFRGLNADNKTLRVLEIVLPPNLSSQISRIRRAAGKKMRCGSIVCKGRKSNKATSTLGTTETTTPTTGTTIKTYKLRPWKPETAHQLWMKHFEKQKSTTTKPPFGHYYYPYPPYPLYPPPYNSHPLHLHQYELVNKT